VAGWVDNACTRYALNEPPQCRPGGSCAVATDLALCAGPDQRTGTLASCKSAACRKACPAGALVTDYDTIAEVCHTSGRQLCALGFQCNFEGECSEFTQQPTPEPTPAPTPVPSNRFAVACARRQQHC
jgi:hypothetical protein